MGDDLDLALASLLDDDLVLEVANTALNLDLLLKELLEGGGVEDLVARGLLGVDDELERGKKLSALSARMSPDPRAPERDFVRRRGNGWIAYLLGRLGRLAGLLL